MLKWPFFKKKNGLTPWKKTQFFDFLNFFFLQLKKALFVKEYPKTPFPGLYWFNKKKDWKKAIL